MSAAPTPNTIAPPAGAGRLPLCGLLALSTAAFTDVMTDLLPAGVLPQMSSALHVSEERAGLLVSAFAVASALAAIPLTAALRGLRRRPVLIGALTGFAVFDAVTAFSSSYPLTFAARLLAGAMGGTMWSMLAGYAARMVPAARRGRATAIVLAGITIALSLGIPAGTALATAFGWPTSPRPARPPPIVLAGIPIAPSLGIPAGTALATAFGWRTSFALLAALAVLLVAWVGWKVPSFPGEAAAARTPLRRVAVRPGIATVLLVTLLLLTAHQAIYTYIVPFAAHSGFRHPALVLFVFGAATVAGIWITGIVVDRHLRPALLGAAALVATAMLALGLYGHVHAVLVTAVAVWGAAFGGAPTLLKTALIDASSPASADVATSMQTTVYNLGIAAGSQIGRAH